MVKQVNIVYEYAFDHADVIVVPDKLIPKIEEIGQEFLFWKPPEDDTDYWKLINGRKYQVGNAEGFVKWLNSFYCHGADKAYILLKDTQACLDNPTIDF